MSYYSLKEVVIDDDDDEEEEEEEEEEEDNLFRLVLKKIIVFINLLKLVWPWIKTLFLSFCSFLPINCLFFVFYLLIN